MKKESESPPNFTKDRILSFDRYKERRDLLGAILEDGKKYTMAEVDSAIDKFMKG